MAPRLTILYGGLLLCTTTPTTSAFHNPTNNLSPIRHPKQQQCSTALHNNGYCADLSEYANRDINAMHDWAYNYGVQQAEGFSLTSYDGYDFFAMAGEDIPAGTCVLYVPSNLYLTSYGSKQEFGQQEEAESLIGNLAGADQFPLFYLFLKILVEYERGQDSSWFPWREF